MSGSSERLALGIDEAGHMLGLSRSSVYRAVKSGHIEAIRVGGGVPVLRKPLERMLTGAAAVDIDTDSTEQ